MNENGLRAGKNELFEEYYNGVWVCEANIYVVIMSGSSMLREQTGERETHRKRTKKTRTVAG